MKLKIKIAGPKVHDVGYRVFLLKNAMNLALPGLSTYNWEENDSHEVIVLVEGDEARIAAFRQMQTDIGYIKNGLACSEPVFLILPPQEYFHFFCLYLVTLTPVFRE